MRVISYPISLHKEEKVDAGMFSSDWNPNSSDIIIEIGLFEYMYIQVLYFIQMFKLVRNKGLSGSTFIKYHCNTEDLRLYDYDCTSV